MARREERLTAIAAELKGYVSTGYIDVSLDDCAQRLEAMLATLGGANLVIISAGTGYLNAQHDVPLDQETIAVNVHGFVAIAEAAFFHFRQRGHGHLAAITSIAALRGNAAANVYAASKAFQSVYLDGLRESARNERLPITITELQPGFVDTDMMKTATPLPPLVRSLLVSDTTTAAHQMLRAISNKRKHAYIPRRYAAIAWLLRILPRP